MQARLSGLWRDMYLMVNYTIILGGFSQYIYFCVNDSTKKTFLAQKPWKFLPLCLVQGEQGHYGCHQPPFKVPQV